MNELRAGPPLLRSPVPWTFSHDQVFLFEIDVAAIDLEVPRGRFLQEVRPGVGLVGIGGLTAPAGNLGRLPALVEINWFVLLEPDLSLPMPTARFAMLTGRVASDCPAFLDHCERADKLPVYRSRGLRVEHDPAASAYRAEDEHGPIFSMRSTFTGTPRFEPRTLWLQHHSTQGGGWIQVFRWEGGFFEHQQGHDAATVHPHPFFDGIDTRGLGDRCYMQMIVPPRGDIALTLYEPQPARGAR